MTRGIKIWTNIDIESATREKGIRFNFRNKKERKENNEKRKTNHNCIKHVLQRSCYHKIKGVGTRTQRTR